MKHWIIVIVAITLMILHERLSATKFWFLGASCILQSRELTKKDTSGRFEFLLT